jgi:hypothetical protein
MKQAAVKDICNITIFILFFLTFQFLKICLEFSVNTQENLHFFKTLLFKIGGAAYLWEY